MSDLMRKEVQRRYGATQSKSRPSYQPTRSIRLWEYDGYQRHVISSKSSSSTYKTCKTCGESFSPNSTPFDERMHIRLCILFRHRSRQGYICKQSWKDDPSATPELYSTYIQFYQHIADCDITDDAGEVIGVSECREIYNILVKTVVEELRVLDHKEYDRRDKRYVSPSRAFVDAETRFEVATLWNDFEPPVRGRKEVFPVYVEHLESDTDTKRTRYKELHKARVKDRQFHRVQSASQTRPSHVVRSTTASSKGQPSQHYRETNLSTQLPAAKGRHAAGTPQAGEGSTPAWSAQVDGPRRSARIAAQNVRRNPPSQVQ